MAKDRTYSGMTLPQRIARKQKLDLIAYHVWAYVEIQSRSTAREIESIEAVKVRVKREDALKFVRKFTTCSAKDYAEAIKYMRPVDLLIYPRFRTRDIVICGVMIVALTKEYRAD